MENERQLLLEKLLQIENIVCKNPCGMSDITYKVNWVRWYFGVNNK